MTMLELVLFWGPHRPLLAWELVERMPPKPKPLTSEQILDRIIEGTW